jgi:glucosamine-6-phosphate deaminase
MNPKRYDTTSSVEAYELLRSKREAQYVPTEKIKIIEVENFPLLGKLAALRFVEWVLKNPGGVVALPTGKTPEHFIKWVQRILSHWETKEIQQLLETFGICRAGKPDMKSLSLVQIDEFYPMNAQQHNSFNYYVNEFYIKGFGLTPEQALLIDATSLGLPRGKTMEEIFPNNIVDLTLRIRQTRTDPERLQKEVINRVDLFCMEYEAKIREMGGIGFFLGGIGPDGHVAFNVRGSSIWSVTRLTGTNYETQAAAATELGGIEISRNRLVITIGLATITYNPTAAVVIIAAGEAKASIVALAVQETKSPQYPASVLQDIHGARLYLTKGAASKLVERRYADFIALDRYDDETTDDVLISLALQRKTSLVELTNDDISSDRFSKMLLQQTNVPLQKLSSDTRRRIIEKIDRGLRQIGNTVFLHTEPHHDDIMLSYLTYIYHLVRDPSNQHYFANLTSGFTSVTNSYLLSIVHKLEQHLCQPVFSNLLNQGYFEPQSTSKRMEDVYLYLDGTASNNDERKGEAEARRLLRNLIEVYRSTDIEILRTRVKDLNKYLMKQYPGAKDPPDIQVLKGTLREWEVELLWAYFGIESSSIHALRLGFYRGDIFSEDPEIDRDVLPIYQLIKKIKPNVVSVAFDPEGSGPDTHYKTLQAVAEALRMYERESGDSSIRVWGYRNVWYRFTPAEANLMIPVSLNTLSLLHTAFMNCFGSQRAASFPSYEHDGPFSELAQQIQVQQYAAIKTCLGKEYFLKHTHPRLRAARGMIFLKEMSLDEFQEKVRELKKVTEIEA